MGFTEMRDLLVKHFNKIAADILLMELAMH